MAYIQYHGGRCCGVRHMHSFNGNETEEDLRTLLSRTRQHKTQGMLVEAVLTNAQLKNSQLAENLQKVGFKLVSRFRNPNSGNVCNVFHYNQAPRPLSSRLPFKIIQQQAA